MHHPECGDGFMGAYMGQNQLNNIPEIRAVYRLVGYTAMKLLTYNNERKGY